MGLLERLGTSWATIGTIVVSAVLVYIAVAATVAVGSTVASTALGTAPLMAGVHRREQVHAVVLETTGDMSVLRGAGPFDRELLQGVRGAERLQVRP
jgi:hypothetical protein